MNTKEDILKNACNQTNDGPHRLPYYFPTMEFNGYQGVNKHKNIPTSRNKNNGSHKLMLKKVKVVNLLIKFTHTLVKHPGEHKHPNSQC